LPSPARSEAPAAPALFAQTAFMRLWYARLAGVAASQMLLVALGWEMYALTGSTFDLGLVGLAQFVPALLLALPAGHAIDRLHRARIVAACFATMLAASIVLWAAAWSGSTGRGLLLGLAVVLGAVRAFQMPAQQALVPALVPLALLPRALAFSSSGMQGAIIAGPAIGGFVFVAGASALYATCAALFALATALVLRVNYDFVPPRREPATLRSLFAGVGFIRERPVVLGAISLDLFAVLLAGVTALLPVYAKDVLGTDAWGLGLLRAAPAVGALTMALVLARWPLQRHAGAWLLGAVALYGATMLGFAVSTTLALSLAALAIGGAADMVSIVIRQTLVQLETPDAMRGRVSAVNSVFIGASNQLGEFRAGAMASVVGPFAAVVAGGLGTIAVAALWARLFPALAQRDRLVPPG
jgi:MFS family permease